MYTILTMHILTTIGFGSLIFDSSSSNVLDANGAFSNKVSLMRRMHTHTHTHVQHMHHTHIYIHKPSPDYQAKF